ncbi:hypothetical protein EVAR_24956_1 [Eumeta japonica]|uniref:Uncharacterized protein n=1 Tax=Eumeta variegata TaxID=151549 RepID=A0A4C2A080_EUMVA|nr:hypothetical protein EVAR_24956_1 [Eumeta japonica]
MQTAISTRRSGVLKLPTDSKLPTPNRLTRREVVQDIYHAKSLPLSLIETVFGFYKTHVFRFLLNYRSDIDLTIKSNRILHPKQIISSEADIKWRPDKIEISHYTFIELRVKTEAEKMLIIIVFNVR